MKLIRISTFVLTALAFTLSLAVRAQAQTVTDLANFNGQTYQTGSAGLFPGRQDCPSGTRCEATDANREG
jgi:hypothetical protein